MSHTSASSLPESAPSLPLAEPATHPATSGVDKSGERVKAMFGSIALQYDRMNHLLSGGVDYYWRWRTIRMCPPRGTAPILDVCTGTGDLALAYWQAAGRKVPVYGTDFTPEMLDLAREKAIARKPVGQEPPPQWIEADTQHLPFESNTFQLVSVAFGLRNVSDTDKGLAEMTRVCQPGGRVVVLEFSLPGNALLRAGYLWYFQNVLPRLGQWLARNQHAAYNYLPDSVAEFPYGEALCERFRQAGLQQVWHRPLTFGIATLYCGTKPLGDAPANGSAFNPA